MLLSLIYVVAVDIYRTDERNLKRTGSLPDTRWICNKEGRWGSEVSRYIWENKDVYSGIQSVEASVDASLMIFVSETKEDGCR